MGAAPGLSRSGSVRPPRPRRRAGHVHRFGTRRRIRRGVVPSPGTITYGLSLVARGDLQLLVVLLELGNRTLRISGSRERVRARLQLDVVEADLTLLASVEAVHRRCAGVSMASAGLGGGSPSSDAPDRRRGELWCRAVSTPFSSGERRARCSRACFVVRSLRARCRLALQACGSAQGRGMSRPGHSAGHLLLLTSGRR